MSRRRLLSALPWLAIPAAVLAAYWPAVRGTFLWDDDAHVTAPVLRSLHGLWRIWLDLHATQQYYPLLHSVFWLEHRLWGDAVLGYHLANLAQHALAACLVVLIVRRLALPGAWLAGMFFALHPVCVEAVAWISEQKSTLSAVFYLSSAFVYLGFDRTRRRSSYFWALSLFILALLTKTVTATLPAALLVIFWWKRGRLDFRRDVHPLLPWLAIGAAAGLFTAWVERFVIGAKGPDFAVTPVQRCLIAGRVIFFYASKVLWPVNLIFTYPRWNVDPKVWLQWLFPLAAVALAIALALLARRRRAPLAAFLFFGGTLFPVLGFFNVYPFKFSFVADHFQYLATLGILVPPAVVISKVGRGHALPSALRRALSPLLLLTLAILTFRQTRMYADSEALYRAVLARNPASWMAHNNLGVTFTMRGRFAEAIAQYQAALQYLRPDLPHDALAAVLSRRPATRAESLAELQDIVRIMTPDNAAAHNALGSALLQLPGKLPDALAEFETALRIEPNYADAHNNRGSALARTLGRLPEAIAEYQTALRLNPNLAEAHNNLGSAFSQMPGRSADAVSEFQAAVRIRPDFVEARNNLAMTLAQMPGRMSDAIVEFQAALRARPDYVRTHTNLGNALAQAGHLEEAVAEYKATLRRLPNDPEAHNNLGVALSQMPGRLQDAIAEYQVAVRLQPDRAEAHNNLGRALAQLPGRLPEAIAEYRAALQIQPDYLQGRVNLADALAKAPGRRADAITEYQAVLRARPDLETAKQSIRRLQAKRP